MKEALQRFAAYAAGSASKERLLYGPVDNRLLRGSFNRYGRPAQNYGRVLTALMADFEVLQRFARVT